MTVFCKDTEDEPRPCQTSPQKACIDHPLPQTLHHENITQNDNETTQHRFVDPVVDPLYTIVDHSLYINDIYQYEQYLFFDPGSGNTYSISPVYNVPFAHDFFSNIQ